MAAFKALFIVSVLAAVGSAFPGWSGESRTLNQPPITAAAIFALSGNAAKDNASDLAGVRLAVKEINSGGGILGREFTVMELDNRSMPLGSKSAVEKADLLGVAAILGPSWSSHALAAARAAQQKKIPMLACMATHPDVTRTGDYIFRAGYTDDFQGRVMAVLARTYLGATTASLLVNSTSDFSISMAGYFKEHFEKIGGRVLTEVYYKPNHLKAAPYVAAVKKDSPGVIFIPGHGESGFLARACQEQPPLVPVLGGDGWGLGTFYRVGGKGIKLGYYCTHWAPEVDFPASRNFVLKYGGEAEINEALAMGYETTMILADAIRRAGSDDRAAIRRALAETRDFPGVTGPISFDHHGDPTKNAVIIEIRDGAPVFLNTVSPRED
ncbi:MAG: ABC transporter substrate-binding protein [Pseudomonadota bacterium]